MSDSPFPCHPEVADEWRRVDTEAVRRAVRPEEGGVVPSAQAADLVARFSLSGVEALMLQLLDTATDLADPPVSQYRVGIVGLERESGDLLLGGNLEFPGTHLGTTVHGEGFVMTRAVQRGTSVSVLALRRAHPCAHCRQFLAEFSASTGLTLVDTLGHRLSLPDLYPWPFAPAALGQDGLTTGTDNWPGLVADGPADLLAAGRRSWTPYSGCPAAAVVETADGARFAGPAVESVAFNPSMAPLQSALIAARAHGRAWSAIRRVWLGTVVGGAVDHTRSASELLDAVAPSAELVVVDWRL